MDALVILGLSIIFQLAAAIFAVKLLLQPGRRIAGILTLTIILLMAFRRFISLRHIVAGGPATIDLFAESTALVISILILCGILYLTRLIRSEQRMAASLADSTLRYQTLLDQSPDGILLIDMKGHILEFNETAARDRGYTREEFKGIHLTDIDPNVTREVVQKRIEVNEKKGKAELEVQHRTKTGDVRDVLVISRVVEIGGEKFFHAIWRDITERKKAEQSLKDSLSLLRATLESTADGILVVDNQGRISDFNEQFSRLWHIPQEILGSREDSRALGYVLGQLKEPGRFIDKVRELYAQPDAVSYDVVEFTDGRIFERYSQPQKIDNRPVGRVWSFRDITEPKRAEEALRASEANLKRAERIGGLGNWEWNIVTSELVWSDELYRILGLDPLTSQPSFDVVAQTMAPEGRDLFAAAVKKALKDVAPFDGEYRLIRQDGTIRFIHTTAEIFRDQQGRGVSMFGIVQDITERKQAELALRESEERLNTILNNVGAYIFLKDNQYRYTYANQMVGELLGAGPEEIVGKSDSAFFSPKSVEEIMQSDRAVIERGETIRREEVELTAKDKQSRSFWTVKLPLRDVNGTIIGLCGISTDITEHKQAEERIRQNEQFIRNILDTVDEGFIVIDKAYRILTANKAYCIQAGLPCADIVGRSCYEVSHKTARPCYEEGEECAVRQVFATGAPHSALHKHVDRDGNILFVETKGFPIKDASGNVTSVIETISNITEKHLLEEERLKTQKLESIGTLAGGIAHDFNNLLQGIFGYITMAKMTFDKKENALAMLEQAEKALHQSVNLTTQLLTFSKGGKPVKKPADLRPIIENSAKFMLSGSRSDIHLDLPDDLWYAEVDEGQFGQVIQNIVLNADQAMPAGGTVRITAANAAEGDIALPPGLSPGAHVVISIQDAGVGIPEEHLGKIFDPYFTTKEKGSGLGLATSYSIVRNHGGMIEVRTKSGEGTTFTIWLPAILEKAFTTAPARSSALQPTRRARILVMDDEDIIRHLSGVLLGALGHEVEVAQEGGEALDKYQQAMTSGSPFDVVILDLTVRGGMGGMETIQKLLEIDPSVKAIVSSGYSEDAVIASHLAHGFKAYLKKPYDVDELREILSALMV